MKMKLFLIVSCFVGLSTIWGAEADRAAIGAVKCENCETLQKDLEEVSDLVQKNNEKERKFINNAITLFKEIQTSGTIINKRLNQKNLDYTLDHITSYIVKVKDALDLQKQQTSVGTQLDELKLQIKNFEQEKEEISKQLKNQNRTLDAYNDAIQGFNIDKVYKRAGLKKPEIKSHSVNICIIKTIHEDTEKHSEYLKQENKNYAKQMAVAGLGGIAVGIALTHLYKTGKFNFVLNPMGSMFTGVKNFGLGLTGFAGNALSKMVSRR